MKKFWREIIDRIIICLPHYWFMFKRYDPDWDKEFESLLRTEMFFPLYWSDGEEDIFAARLGGFSVWILNYPYCTFHKIHRFAYPQNGRYCEYNNERPSRLNILRGKRKLDQDLATARKLLSL